MCSYAGLIDLQSSINISGALGNSALTLTSISTIIFCLLFTPLVVMKLGAKVTLVVSQGCYLIYVLANFYPETYTLLPAGVCLGIGEALLFTPVLMYCTYYGRTIAECKGKSKKDYINRYLGYFSGVYKMNEMFSNLISFVVLGIGKYLMNQHAEDGASENDLMLQNSTISHPISPTSPLNVHTQFYQTSTVLNSTFSNQNNSVNKILHSDSVTTDNDSGAINMTQHLKTVFNIANSTFYPTVSTLHSNTSVTFPLYTVTTSPLVSYSNDSSIEKFAMCGANDCYDENEFDSAMDHYVPMSSSAFYIMVSMYAMLGIAAIPIMMLIPALPKDVPLDDETDSEPENEELDQTKTSPSKSDKSAYRVICSNFQDTLRHLVNYQQILLTPLSIYHGLYISFISSEINRAYVSCTVGVERVGIGMFAGGILNASVSFLFGAIAGRILLRNCCVAIAITIDLTLYIFCLYWRPTEDTVWFAYIICLLFGATDGVWEPFLDGKYAKYFSNNEEVAYSVYVIWTCVGYAMTYGWTAVLCIRDKLYIQIMVLMIGVVCCGGAELLQRRKVKLQL